ncbi:polyketide synthase [Grosmannia clavigera kw1407]|uniref:Polyketide synthase n=1 Tax=Grosmannia clavigera (strain kw1407 / UAMH 11150) TaxID=655863 RepID=F0XQD5_GROCL|nr:polyketide synthase [Grosmannia clavigera kw1407]EFX00060.1 polyketide synthase [Grosmannia clavigera kw1407]
MQETKQKLPASPMRIAVVGMSCRLSGNVSSLDDFWQMLARARCGWSEVPDERFSKKAYHHPNPAKLGAFNTIGGYFVDQDPAMFDAPFFNITQAEAEAMDPQQRLLLECAYEAVENAGIPKERLIGQKVGVFVGGAASDYRLGTLRDLEQTPMFDATGSHQSIQSGRISHYFDLRGPSFTVDTACSSSLYALHQAVQSIRNGESEQAIVAACHLNLQPGDWVSMSLSRLFSDEGKTYAFDHRAKSGFARGEGAGALILKPLDQAIRDNDRIWSVIVNTGVNQDGRTVGITSPSGEAQEGLMREVYASAGIRPEDVGFVEAHGTGTKVGDPIEATAIRNVFSHGRTRQQPLYVGSVKSNVGHLESASGVISIIKASLMLDKRFLLPNVNFEKLNEAIPFDEWHAKVPTRQRPWPSKKRYISVNNFGFGGSNAHCVLEPAPRRSGRPELAQKNLGSGLERPRLFVLSANDEASARRAVSQLTVYLEQHPEVFQKELLRNLAYTLNERRSQLGWRVGLVASSGRQLVEVLSAAETKPVRRPQQPPKLAFVYTGQGAQWHAMGRELLESHVVFRDTVRAADACLQRLGADFSLMEELQRDKETTRVGQAHISQPICSAVQLGLTDLLRSWGIRPTAVTGHSSGEIGAAYAAGALSLEAAMTIAYQRGQVVLRLRERFPHLRGSMMAVGAGPDTVLPLAQRMKSGVVVVACENSPSSVTASGDEAAIDELAAAVEALQLFNRKLQVDVAYHSPHMKLVADEYLQMIGDLASSSSSDVRFFSSLKGHEVGLDSLGPAYWVDNLTCPVRFSTALAALCTDCRPDVLVEIGPHAALAGPIQQTLKTLSQPSNGHKIGYVSALSRGQNATTTALQVAATLCMRGQTVDFDAINGEEQLQVTDGKPTLLSDLTPYGWSRQRYWSESRMSEQHRRKPFARHDLLGLLADFSNNELAPTWRNVLRTADLPWLRDHTMQSLTTFPFAGFVAMAVEAAAQRASMRKTGADEGCEFVLREVQVTRPLLMDDETAYEVMLSMEPYAESMRAYSDEWDEFRIRSWRSGPGWTEHCRGLVSTRKAAGAGGDSSTNPVSTAHHGMGWRSFQRADTAADEKVDVDAFYRELDDVGATYGPTFRRLRNVRASNVCSAAIVDVADTAATMPMEHESAYHVHPALLDQVLQLSFPLLGAGRSGGMRTLYMPAAMRELRILSGTTSPLLPGSRLRMAAETEPDLDLEHEAPAEFDMTAVDQNDAAVIQLAGLQMVPVKSEATLEDTPRELCYKLQWEPVPLAGRRISDTSIDSTDSGYVSPVPAPLDDDDSGEPVWADMAVSIVSDMPLTDPVLACLVAAVATKTNKKPVVQKLAEATSDQNSHVILCELDRPQLAELDADRFGRLQALATTAAGLLWVTRGAHMQATNPTGSMALGLTRTLRSEMAARVATIDLDPRPSGQTERQVSLVLQAFGRIFRPTTEGEDADMEYAEQDGGLAVPRIVDDVETNLLVHRELYGSAPYTQDFAQPGRQLKLAIGTKGALDTLYFAEDEPTELGKDEIELRVEATGMNFKDVVIAMGQLPSRYLGIECAGVVVRTGTAVRHLVPGDRVCAMTEGAYGSVARCLATSAARIPDEMAFDVAASIPVVYCTAHYGLIELARLTAGERVLIHAAAGGVGQAAIQLARLLGAEVFATVGSPEKKRFLQDRYAIPADHIFSSRDTAFGTAVREATDGHGVDVVLNSLAGDFLRESWDCLAHFGRFIEIGKRDISANSRLEMRRFQWNASFHSVDLTVLATERPRQMAQTFSAVMQLFAANSVSAIGPISVYGVAQIETAFRLLQSGKTTGKLVVVPRTGEQVRAVHPSRHHDRIHGRRLLRPDATYLLVGGTGGLGRSLSRWMVAQGARHIVLLSRRGLVDGPVADLVRDMAAQGANIVVRACDVADRSGLTSVVQSCAKELPPIAGVVHASMVLRDVLFEKMTWNDYDAVIRSKVAGAWNLHHILSDTPLDFFVLLSSAAGIVGNRGQAAYAAANTFLDAFARHRFQQGLPATALDLTAVADVGYLVDGADAARQHEVLRNLGGETIHEAEILALFRAALTGDLHRTCASHCMTGLKLGSSADQMPYFAADARFTHLRDAVLATQAASGADSAATHVSLAVALGRAPSPEEAVAVVTAGLVSKLAGILMVPAEDFDPDTPITKYGLDSLNAIELRNWITKELATNLQVLELLTSGSLTNLASTIIKKRTATQTKS